MLDKTKQAKSETYTPEQYLRDLKAVTDKAIKAGVTLEQAAQATMGFAHALWDECYENGSELLGGIQEAHPTWDSIGAELDREGFPSASH